MKSLSVRTVFLVVFSLGSVGSMRGFACDPDLSYMDAKWAHYNSGDTSGMADTLSDWAKSGKVKSPYNPDWSHDINYIRNNLMSTKVGDVVAQYQSQGINSYSAMILDLLNKKTLSKEFYEQCEIGVRNTHTENAGDPIIDNILKDQPIPLSMARETGEREDLLIATHWYYEYCREMAVQIACRAASGGAQAQPSSSSSSTPTVPTPDQTQSTQTPNSASVVSTPDQSQSTQMAQPSIGTPPSTPAPVATQADQGNSQAPDTQNPGNNTTFNTKAEATAYLIKANAGDIESARKLGTLYLCDKGVQKDYVDALRWLRKAADQGDAEAQQKIGRMFSNGWGVTKDDSQALEWYQKAADQGNSLALYYIGHHHLYDLGLRTDENDDKVQPWFKRALPGIHTLADQGDPESQDILGDMYNEGFGVTQDYSQAANWYQKAADQGYADGQSDLGWMFMQGHGVTANKKLAISWFRRSADQEDAVGEYSLGYSYDSGTGVIQDYSQAASWYQKAAEQGDVVSQFRLGNMYEDGEGVAKDTNKAVEWYQKAARQGHEGALYRLKQLGH